MITQKSPGGSIFPYYYKGGEIHCLKYGSFFADEDALFAVMKAEAAFIAKPNRRLRIWVDFYQTQLTDTVLLEFLRNIQNIQAHVIQLAIVGFSLKDQWRLHRLGKKEGLAISVPLKFFRDPEEAKTWLVGKPF